MKWDKSKLRANMMALSSKGEKLGKVLRYSDKSLFIEGKGGKEVELALDSIIEIRGNDLICSLSQADEEEIRVLLVAEEADVSVVTKEAGHIRIKKEVKTEEKQFTVPVRKEDVSIERLPGKRASKQTPGDDLFKERTIDLTVHEEEVHVDKHPVVKEELRVRKTTHTEPRHAATSLRHEEAQIEDSTAAAAPAKTAATKETMEAAKTQPPVSAKHAAAPARTSDTKKM